MANRISALMLLAVTACGANGPIAPNPPWTTTSPYQLLSGTYALDSVENRPRVAIAGCVGGSWYGWAVTDNWSVSDGTMMLLGSRLIVGADSSVAGSWGFTTGSGSYKPDCPMYISTDAGTYKLGRARRTGRADSLGLSAVPGALLLMTDHRRLTLSISTQPSSWDYAPARLHFTICDSC